MAAADGPYSLRQRLFAETLGTAFLLMIVVGSGIMGERLSGGNTAIALLANSLATGAGLVVLITMLGPVSGAHFNPIVTCFETVRHRASASAAVLYVMAQFVGAFLGVVFAHVMFGLPMVQASAHARTGVSLGVSEAIATLGLLLTIAKVSKDRPTAIPYAVGAYITSAYWFTSSTSFANPAVTLARAFTNTFAGIRLADVPLFVVFQIVGMGVAYGIVRGLEPREKAP